MYRYVLKRLMMLIPVILGVILLIFIVMDLAPGDPVLMVASPDATEEELERNSDAAGFFYAMFKRFPYATLLNYSNEMNAEVLLGGREWNWNEDPDPKWLEIPVAWPDDPGIYV